MEYFTLSRFFLTCLLCLFSTSLLAESPFQLKVAGLKDTDSLIPKKSSNYNLATKKPKRIFFVQIPGIGRVRVKLNKAVTKDVAPSVTDEFGNVSVDNSGINLYRGSIKLKSKTESAAASVYYKNSVPFLFISFVSTHPRTGEKQINKISINLLNKKIKRAKLKRVNKHSFLKNSSFENDAIPVDIPATPPVAAAVTSSPLTLQEVDLNIDGDSFWNTLHGASANTEITSILNTVEMIYENDHMITFDVVRQNIFAALSFGTNDATDRLCNYQYYTTGVNSLSTDPNCTITATAGPQSYTNDADHHHLFTGEDLQGSTLGVAFVGTICRSPSAAIGISQHNFDNSVITSFTFAHELGHSFSAIHDNSTGWNGYETATCPATASASIMSASVNPFSPPDSNFSACAIEDVNAFLGIYNTCLTSTTGPDPSPSPTASPSASPDPVGDITLTAKLTKKGKITLNVTLPVVAESCEVSVLFNSNKSKIDSSKQMLTFDNSETDISISTKHKVTINPNKKGKFKKVFVKAQMLCSNVLTAESTTRNLKPKKVQSEKSQSVGRWIKKVKGKLQKKL